MDFTELFSLEGRTALITGGSRGIGRMIAEGYLTQGARVYISARNAEACEQAATELSELGECYAIPADVSTTEGIRALAGEVGRWEHKLDILVNNAGAAWGAPFDEFPESGWDKVMNLNVKGLFFLTQALRPMMARSGDEQLAKVINIASIDGIAVSPLETYSYHASKAGVLHLTKRMAIELIKSGIVVSGIAPGAFASEMNRAARDRADLVIPHVPAGRIGASEDMAATAVFLASR